MAYINKSARGAVRRIPGMGDVVSDFLCSNFNVGCQASPGTAPDVNANLPTSPEDVSMGPQTQVSTEGGQVSPIPSSQPGGAITTISGFTSVGGVCKPNDSTTLSAFKELQRQMNRVADVLGLTKIPVDGAIGSQTLGLMNQIKSKASVAAGGGTFGWVNFLSNQSTSSCSAVAGGAVNITYMLSQMADDLGVSSSVASPSPASPPTIYNPLTGKDEQQGLASSIGDAFKNLSTGMQVAALGVFGGIGYFLYKDAKKHTKRRR